jgi:hypothetical protein
MFERTQLQLPPPGAEHHDQQAHANRNKKPMAIDAPERRAQLIELHVTKRQVEEAAADE